MIEEQVRLLMLWQSWREKAAKWRRGDEGVTTIEMVIIGGFLIAAAGALAVLFSTIWNNQHTKITDKNVPAGP